MEETKRTQQTLSRWRWLGTWRATAAMVVVLALAGLIGFGATQHNQARPAHADDDDARVSVIIRPAPSIQVVAGDIISYQVRARNDGKGDASHVKIRLNYAPSQLSIEAVAFERENGWVPKQETGSLFIEFPAVGGEKSRSCVVRARTAADLPNETIIHLWAEYNYLDEGGNLAKQNRGNAAPVLVGNVPLTSRWKWMAVEPQSGKVGTTFRFFSNRFVPGEHIKSYLISRDGIHRRRSLDSQANGEGHFWIHFEETSSLTPGTYQLSVIGERSELVAGAVFVVEP
jgi:hypothetical protein